MICNPAYKGEFVWEHKTAGRFVIPVPPIVSPEEWAAAQRHKRGAPVRIPLVLSGHLRCGRCGASMSVRKVARAGELVYLYYRCASYGTPAGHCGAGLARRDRLEPKAEAKLREVMSSAALLREIMTPDTSRSDHDRRRLDALDERAERVKEMRLDGIYNRDEARAKMAEIDAERHALIRDTPGGDLPLEEYARAAREMPFADLITLVGAVFTVLDGEVTVELGDA